MKQANTCQGFFTSPYNLITKSQLCSPLCDETVSTWTSKVTLAGQNIWLKSKQKLAEWREGVGVSAGTELQLCGERSLAIWPLASAIPMTEVTYKDSFVIL